MQGYCSARGLRLGDEPLKSNVLGNNPNHIGLELFCSGAINICILSVRAPLGLANSYA